MGGDMKLLQVTNWFYLLTLTLFFLIAGIVLYFFIRTALNEDIDEQLNHKRIALIESMSYLDSLSTESMKLHDNISFKKIDSQFNSSVQYFHKVMMDRGDRRRGGHRNFSKEFDIAREDGQPERIPFRIIHFQAKTRCCLYDVRIWQSEVEADDLIESIFISLMTVFGVCCVILFIANYYFSKRLLSPLISTISSIREWDLKNSDKLVTLESTYIKEFNALNDSLQKMITQLISDYHRMKEFTENASHELQTPVAIIRTKLETLMQNEELNDNQAQLIQQAFENTVRLSKINQTLLLLSKIESNQFGQLEQVAFVEIFTKLISHFEDLMEFKNVHLKMDVQDDFICIINRGLAEILLSNLLSNAINHNIDGGDIFVSIKKDGFEICNSGIAPIFPTEQMFARFKKGNQVSSNVGLGLALVKEIAENNGLSISYRYENELHKLILTRDKNLQ